MTLAAQVASKVMLLESGAVQGFSSGLRVRSENYLDETTFFVHPEDYRALCERLYKAGFDFPRCLSGSDMEFGLRVTLHLQSLETKTKAIIITDLKYAAPRVASVSDLWGGVEWHEREAYDLVGITFENHPDLRRILLEDDWTIHPLQRKYNTRGYLVSTWTEKTFPTPAVWEEGFVPFSAVSAPVAHAPKATSPAGTAAAPTTETSSATEPSSAAAPAGEAEAPAKKQPKRWVPKDGSAPSTPAAESSSDVGALLAAPASAPTAPEPTPAPVAAVETSSAPASEEPKNPKIKRWIPKTKEGE
jgi:NADH-quinone oxidoreductase subunit C